MVDIQFISLLAKFDMANIKTLKKIKNFVLPTEQIHETSQQLIAEDNLKAAENATRFHKNIRDGFMPHREAVLLLKKQVSHYKLP